MDPASGREVFALAMFGRGGAPLTTYRAYRHAGPETPRRATPEQTGPTPRGLTPRVPGGTASKEPRAATGRRKPRRHSCALLARVFKAYPDGDRSAPPATAPSFTTLMANVSVSARDGSLAVSWHARTGTTGRDAQWKSGAEEWDSTKRRDAVASGAVTGRTITGLTNAAEYTIRVRSKKSGSPGNTGEWSDEAKGASAENTLAGSGITSTAPTGALTAAARRTYALTADGASVSLELATGHLTTPGPLFPAAENWTKTGVVLYLHGDFQSVVRGGWSHSVHFSDLDEAGRRSCFSTSRAQRPAVGRGPRSRGRACEFMERFATVEFSTLAADAGTRRGPGTRGSPRGDGQRAARPAAPRLPRHEPAPAEIPVSPGRSRVGCWRNADRIAGWRSA